MSVTEVKQALGEWSVTLDPTTPKAVLDAITPFGHIAVVPGAGIDVEDAGDGLLAAARYVGVYRSRQAGGDDGYVLGGAGLAFWLGDEDDKGAVFVSPVVSASATFANAVRQLIPASLAEGMLSTPPGAGTWTNTTQYVTPRTALTYLTDTYSTDTYPVSWRVNNNGTLDAGPDSVLFVTSPRAILVRKRSGPELDFVGVHGQMELDQDVEDYTTKVVLLAEGEGGSTVTASASLVTAYRDLRGNLVNLTRLVSEFETDGANAPARATLQLNRFKNPRYAVSLNTDDFDVKGDFQVGDSIYVFDPANGFVSTQNEIVWRGQEINPLAMKVTELTWPIPAGWTVAFRDGNGVWTDLSPYYRPESGQTTVQVGDYSNALTNADSQPIGNRPIADTSTPATPAFTSFASSTYQTGSGNGETKAQVQLTWNQPTNIDGSTVMDGRQYTIRWRPNVSAPYASTWDQASGYTWDGVSGNAWQQPLVSPILNTAWNQTVVPWGTNQIMVQELTPGVTYEFQINAADTASPANISPFSTTMAVATAIDFFPPATPAVPEVAASRIAIQVVHRLGSAAGGTFNLDADLDHLEVHVGGSPTFYPDDSTRVGRLPANIGMIRAQVPVVGTFNVEQADTVWVKVVAVDRTGNKSTGSDAASAAALLIDTAHISDLSVSKVTAGTITADWIVSAKIKTAETGSRAVMDSQGFYTYDDQGVNTFWASSTGFVRMIGELSSGPSGSKRIVVNPSGASYPQVRFYPAVGGDYAMISSAPVTISGQTEAWIAVRSSTSAAGLAGQLVVQPNAVRVGMSDSGYGLAGGGAYSDQYQYLSGYFPNNDQRSGFNSGDQWAYAGIFAGTNDIRTGFTANQGGYVSVGRFSADGGQTAGLFVDGPNQNNMHLFGTFLDNTSFASLANDAVVCGAPSQTATGVAIVYGPTMASTPRPVVTPYSTATMGEWKVNGAPSTTGFSEGHTNSVTFRLAYWCFRIA